MYVCVYIGTYVHVCNVYVVCPPISISWAEALPDRQWKSGFQQSFHRTQVLG